MDVRADLEDVRARHEPPPGDQGCGISPAVHPFPFSRGWTGNNDAACVNGLLRTTLDLVTGPRLGFGIVRETDLTQLRQARDYLTPSLPGPHSTTGYLSSGQMSHLMVAFRAVNETKNSF